jgi:hypothetical protein
MPTKRLPADPDMDHLKHQAKDLMRAHAARTLDAAARIREFHPRFRKAEDRDIGDATLSLTDAQFTIARENFDVPAHERITDPLFRRAGDLIDAGDADGLRALLKEHPALAPQRATLEGGNYFTHPSPIEFVAENPTWHGRLPRNIAAVARVILEAGAERESIDRALALVSSSIVARESGVQLEPIDALCDAGADPNDAARGQAAEVIALLLGASTDERQSVLAIAAQRGSPSRDS